uniref:Uncharacterized protein n=1 Tax=Panagrellus redivivus TaxID=6233 RepID=A0A7E4UTG9_PANRE
MDRSGSKRNSKERRTAVQYEGFVLDFKECACYCSPCRAINRSGYLLEKSYQTKTAVSMDISGSKPNSKVKQTECDFPRFQQLRYMQHNTSAPLALACINQHLYAEIL